LENDNPSSPSPEALALYRTQSPSTSSGEFEYLYAVLPRSTIAICKLIKKQLIHPLEASEMKSVLPEGRFYEDSDFLSVSSMLEELVNRDSMGLTLERKPENRLVVACHHHGLLFASILRSQGIPVRIRAGFARYFEEQANVRFGHVICEVWDETEQSWILVDPDRDMVDFSAKKFEFSQHAWLALRENELDKVRYVSALSKDQHAILHILLQDLSCVLGIEKLYWDEPEVLHTNLNDISALNTEELMLLDSVARLLKDPDQNLWLLQSIYADHTLFHPTGQDFSDWYELRTGKSIEDFYTEFK
jgi:hypothetical protein